MINNINSTQGEKIFHTINYILLGIFACMALYPFIYVFSASISSGDAVQQGRVVFFPKEISFESYKKVLAQKGIWMAYANTFFYTIVGTIANMFFTITGSYALSKQRLMGKKFFTMLVVFTMWFKAGMVPFFLNISDLGLYNTRTAVIIGFACQAFNIVLLRNYFESVPKSLEEAAKIDGANDLQILWKVYLPLSRPALATVGLFYAITRWNGYFWSMVLLRDESKIPLQVLLKKLIVEMSVNESLIDAVEMTNAGYSMETVVYATIVISIIPMIVAYPYIQKYFNKGIMLGAVKE